MIPPKVAAKFSRSIQQDSDELRERVEGRIVLVDPPFAFGRQMVVQFADGSRERVPFNHEQILAQRAADLRRSAHWPARRAA